MDMLKGKVLAVQVSKKEPQNLIVAFEVKREVRLQDQSFTETHIYSLKMNNTDKPNVGDTYLAEGKIWELDVGLKGMTNVNLTKLPEVKYAKS